MYKAIYQAIKRKSFRWNTCSKVTAHSIETSYSERQSVGIATNALWNLNLATSQKSTVAFNVNATVAVIANTEFSIRNKIKLNNQAKTWNNRTSFNKKIKVIFRTQNNPILRFVSWQFRQKVKIQRNSTWHQYAASKLSAKTLWNQEQVSKKINLSWNSIGRLILTRNIKANVRTNISKKIKSTWNIRIKLYLLKPIRYKIKEGVRFVIPERSLPAMAYKPSVAVIPNITWNKLSNKKKLKIG